MLSAFARKLGYSSLANRTGFAVIPAYGFNPSRVADFSDGMEATLSVKISRGVIFDRDYRPSAVVDELKQELLKRNQFVWVHDRKELENFLLVPAAIDRAIKIRVQASRDRGGTPRDIACTVDELLNSLTEEIKSDVFGQHSAAGARALCELHGNGSCDRAVGCAR